MKTMKKIGLVAMILLVAIPTKVHAASEDEETTNGTVIVDTTTPNDSVLPVKPNNPTVIEDDRDPLNPATGNIGALTIDTVPFFEFKEYVGTEFVNPKMTTGMKTLYTSIAPSTALDDYVQYIQVSDRRGSGKGWQLDVKATAMNPYTKSGSNYTLITGTPAILSIPFIMNLKPATQHPIAQKGYPLNGHLTSIQPELPTLVNGGIEVTSATTGGVKVLSAGENFGMGTWLLRLEGGSAGTSLQFNTDLVRKNGQENTILYKSDITWELHSLPVGS